MAKKDTMKKGFGQLMQSTAPKEQSEPQEKMVTANYKLPESLHIELKMLSLTKKKHIYEIVSELIKEYIEKNR